MSRIQRLAIVGALLFTGCAANLEHGIANLEVKLGVIDQTLGQRLESTDAKLAQ